MAFKIMIFAGLTISFVGLFFFIRSLKRFIKLPVDEKTNYLRILYGHLVFMLITSIGFLITSLGLTLNSPLNLDTIYVLQAGIGGFFTIFCSLWLLTGSMIYIYKKDLKNEFKPIVLVSSLFNILPIIVAFYFLMEGLVPLISFPLTKGIPLFGDQMITFYSLFIIGGALFVYWMSDIELQRRGYRPGYAENVFLVAFPSGVIGARIWYVIGQWSTEFAGQPFWKVFAIWEGGLAIMGGALFGTLAGLLFVIYRRKDIKIRQAMDIGVPVILVAQAIGRWGNFFNQEVYGNVADVEKWGFLPTFIREQMTIDNQFRVPLFLIEGIVNIIGYIVIRYVVGRGLKKYIVDGDLAMIYPIWYGLTRVIMEPIRHPDYIMDNLWSYYWGIVFAVVGVLGIVILHLIDYYKKQKDRKLPKNV
jgi:prolipoprotein diacylglyceryl transferase